MFRTIFTLCFCLLLTSQTHASLIVNAWETESGHVRLEYDGSLNVADLTVSTIDTFEDHALRRFFGGVISNMTPTNMGGSSFSSAYSATPTVWKSGPVNVASSFGGTALVFNSSALLNVHIADIDDDVWSGTGFMQFDNTTLAGMGVNLSVDRVWTIDNTAANTITLRNFNPTSAVPEPSGLLLFCL